MTEPTLAAAKRSRRVTPPTGWQFSTPAVVAREVTARLFGPIIGWFLCGPRVVGREHLEALNGPSLVAPSHASHFDFSAIRLAMGPRHRRRMTAAAALSRSPSMTTPLMSRGIRSGVARCSTVAR